jgi:ferrochelatase
MKKQDPVAVVLFQLGGPDSLEAIEPFLVNLFSDPDIIDFPFSRIARAPLARLIAASRARRVEAHYARMGGKSPILENTLAQARALVKYLAGRLDVRVFVAMRYWHSLTESVVRALEKDSFESIVLLPLYPQHSKTTTGSSLNDSPKFIAALADLEMNAVGAETPATLGATAGRSWPSLERPSS